MQYSSSTSESCSSSWEALSWLSRETCSAGAGSINYGSGWHISLPLPSWFCKPGWVSTVRSQPSSPGFEFRLVQQRTSRALSSIGSSDSSSMRRRSGSSRLPTQRSQCWCYWFGGAIHHAAAQAEAATPNPSLERDLRRDGTWPARRSGLSSASRAERHPGVGPSAQTLGSTSNLCASSPHSWKRSFSRA